MSLQMFYAWAKKIHKWVMWGVVVLGSWMMLSGYLMQKELEGESFLSSTTMIFFRTWHSNLSEYFLVVFGLQMATGLAIWGVPKILSKRVNKPTQTTS